MSTKQLEKSSARGLVPCCDIFENKGGVSVRLEMPGVSKEGLEIKVDGDLLIITGKKKLSRYKGDFLVHEIREGDYHHELTIDETIDRNQIDASLENGVLNLNLSLKESEKPRKIEVVAK